MVSCSIPAWIGRFLACLGGCFGCCTKPTPIIAVDEPSKGLRIQGFAVKNPGISDGFWSTSTCDLENSAVQSQRSISSTTISNQTLCQSSSVGSASNNSDFVNHGLLLWHESRRHWIESNGSLESRTLQSRQPRLSWNVTYESLIGARNPFPKPIRLSDTINFLVDVWEQEGLYD
ncbi:hypothetical protein HS088_TW04G01582 [Tripterygium wilfordii]|uniref:Gag1-like clamp domain-containing protein n=1 Tax=Tripterygium wilfordii TaxID=458696 RepID=A0A7J7DTA8_TRIWF|nr:uncharacterized protein LOC119995874 isoform X1 [Tripterygium wilfordii]KAF5749612.1 hypothetical protein HS088_TW04G01582 [Tripterygium wilfordii]